MTDIANAIKAQLTAAVAQSGNPDEVLEIVKDWIIGQPFDAGKYRDVLNDLIGYDKELRRVAGLRNRSKFGRGWIVWVDWNDGYKYPVIVTEIVKTKFKASYIEADGIAKGWRIGLSAAEFQLQVTGDIKFFQKTVEEHCKKRGLEPFYHWERAHREVMDMQ